MQTMESAIAALIAKGVVAPADGRAGLGTPGMEPGKGEGQAR
jgi:hypothetical protein